MSKKQKRPRQKKVDRKEYEKEEKAKKDKDWSYDDILRMKSKRTGYRG